MFHYQNKFFFPNQKKFIEEKESVETQCMQTWQAMCVLWPACQKERIFIVGKRKKREGEIKTTELYFKHSSSCRVLKIT